MTQRIFDIFNEKDYADLWDILPIEIKKLYHENDCIDKTTEDIEMFIKINWHDKTEITRPIQEATETDIGKLCYFWDNKTFDDDDEYKGYAILTHKDVAGGKPYYIADGNSTYEHCRRLTKQEIEELC